MAQVTESLRAGAGHHSDQGDVWQTIGRKFNRMNVSSPTDAAEAMYARHEDRLQGYVAACMHIEEETPGPDYSDAFTSTEGQTGAAVYWVENVRGWSVEKPPQGPEPNWSLQLTRMKMFDLLIANIDRNQGNLIYDSDWHLFLIDHSRAFTSKKDLKGIAPLGRVDRELWNKMAALTIVIGVGFYAMTQGKGDASELTTFHDYQDKGLFLAVTAATSIASG